MNRKTTKVKAKPKRDPFAKPKSLDANYSGLLWFKRNNKKFPNSNKLIDLQPDFEKKTRRFIKALRAGGATVKISSTRRNKNRAWVMRYAWKVATGKLTPEQVPQNKKVQINWDHGEALASKKAAKNMVQKFNMAHIAALKSNHISGLAIDMTITWRKLLTIQDAKGKSVTIKTRPRNGTNRALAKVGASFGVKKLVGDAPHWSYNGQ